MYYGNKKINDNYWAGSKQHPCKECKYKYSLCDIESCNAWKQWNKEHKETEK